MSAIQWDVTADSISVKDFLLSMTITQGRNSYIDSYSGGNAVLTFINNYTFQLIANVRLRYGKPVIITSTPSGYNQTFRVQNVEYNDYPGNVGLSTVTITCVDAMATAGRVYADNLVLAQNETYTQANKFERAQGGPLDVNGPFVATSGTSVGTSSIASATTYSGTVLNYWNYLAATEHGFLVNRLDNMYFIQRNKMANFPPIATTFGRETSSTQIGYQQFTRLTANTQMNNVATISPSGLSPVIVENSNSKAVWGPAYYSVSTVDYTTEQATGNGQWLVSTLGNPLDQRYSISFNDVSQNDTALTSWFSQCWGTINRSCNLYYQEPENLLTSVSAFIEGYQINAVPGSTTFTLSLSPLQYYQFFTLDNSTFGVLGGGTIYYDQPEIVYDEFEWTYNDVDASNSASRLGW